MNPAGSLSEHDEIHAAELAFGLLDGDERREGEARVENDPAFSAAYHLWQDYAAALVAGPEEAPRPSIWPKIEVRLPANDTGAVAASALRRWRTSALVAGAAAAVLAVMVVQQTLAPAPQVIQSQPSPPLVAVLTGKTGVVTVSYDPATGRLTSAPTGVDVGDHAAELWVIPADGRPRSLGVIAATAPGWTQAPASAIPAMEPGVTLAISEEPIGGSPTGQPTGPVILAGKVAAT